MSSFTPPNWTDPVHAIGKSVFLDVIGQQSGILCYLRVVVGPAGSGV
jgi:hypothetical protein